jgi:RNA polymerase sigma-32 factor
VLASGLQYRLLMISILLDGQRDRPLRAYDQMQMVREYCRTRRPALEKRLVESNMRLVIKIAREHDRTRGRDLDDLVQEGCLGLLEGIRRFDPSKGTRLTTYAAFWIRAFIMKHLMNNVRLVRFGRTRAQRAAFQQGAVDTNEVSFETAPRPGDRALSDLMADASPRADSLLETAELAHDVRKAAADLEPRLAAREVTILRERLLAAEPTPRQIVARRVSLSDERVRQIEGTLAATIRMGLGSAGLAAAA